MLAYSSQEEISTAVEAKYSRIALTRLSLLDIRADEDLSFRSETIPGKNEQMPLMGRKEFRDYVYDKVLKNDPNKIAEFCKEYESVVYSIDYDQLILGLSVTPRLNRELMNFAGTMTNKYKRTKEELIILIREYIKKNVSMRTCKETGTVEPFMFSALHKFFEPTMNDLGKLRVTSMDAKVSEADNRSYREIVGASVVLEKEIVSVQGKPNKVDVYDLVIKILRGSRVLYKHKRDRAGSFESTEYYFYYYDLVSYTQFYIIRQLYNKLEKMFQSSKIIINRIRIVDQNFDLSGEAPAGTMRAKQAYRDVILDEIMRTGVELSIKNFSHSYGAYLDHEYRKESDKGSVTIEPVNTNRELITVDAKKHLSQILYAMLAVKELVKAAEKFGYTIFDMPIEIFRVYDTSWYEFEGLVSPLSYLNPDTPIVSFMSIMDILREEGLLERKEDSLRRIQQISADILSEKDEVEDSNAPVSRNTHWGMITIQKFAGVDKDSLDYQTMLMKSRMMYAINHDALMLHRLTEDAVGVINDMFFGDTEELFNQPNRKVVSIDEMLETIGNIKNLLVNFTLQQRRMVLSRTRRIDNGDIYHHTEQDDIEDWHSDREILRQRASLMMNYSKGRDAYESILTDLNLSRAKNGFGVTDGTGVLYAIEEVDRYMRDTNSCVWLPDMSRSYRTTEPFGAFMPFSFLDNISWAFKAVLGEDFEWEGSSSDFFRLSGILEVYHKLMIVLDVAEATIRQNYYEEYNNDKEVVASPEIIETFSEVTSIFSHLDREDYMRGMQKVESILQSLDGSFSVSNFRSQKYYSYMNKVTDFKLFGNKVPDALRPYFHVPLYYEEDRVQDSTGLTGMLDLRMQRNHMKLNTLNNVVEKIGYALFKSVNQNRIDFISQVLKTAESCLEFSSMVIDDAEVWTENVLKEESKHLEGIKGKSMVGVTYDEFGYARNGNWEYVYRDSPFDKNTKGYVHCSGYVIYLNLEKREVSRELLD